MSEVGGLLYDFGLAWAAAWAFQLLVIVLPAERENERFNALIAPRVDRLIELGMEVVTARAATERLAPDSGTSEGPEPGL